MLKVLKLKLQIYLYKYLITILLMKYGISLGYDGVFCKYYVVHSEYLFMKFNLFFKNQKNNIIEKSLYENTKLSRLNKIHNSLN